MARVVDVVLFDGDIPSAVDILITGSTQNEKLNMLVSATGAHGIVTAHKDSDFRQILEKFFLNLPDGMPAVWVSKLKGDKNIERCYGPDFFRELIIASREENINHYLCGGKEGVAEKLRTVCFQEFFNTNIVGTYSPPFRDISEDEFKVLAKDIDSLGANIVWIGLSTPKQEKFAYHLSQYTNVDFICTIGAAFDFHTGGVVQAPSWMQQIGLEWLFRLFVEPKRLWKRYLEIVPLFIAYNIADIIR